MMIKMEPVPSLAEQHADSVIAVIRRNYDENNIISEVKRLGVNSIKEFLTADVLTMRNWVEKCPEKLQFTQFRDIYNRYFSNGADKFVDGDYNAYKFLDSLGIAVCPYCDDEYIDTVVIKGKKKRTSEIDHFFPKGKYPALAMCFYNLVPSGQNCNGLKKENELGANPYEDDIESLTYLYPDIPVGISMEKLEPKDCKIMFHPLGRMRQNVNELGLQQRYERHSAEAHRLLKNLQNYSEEKIEELVRLGCGTREEIISSNFGPQDPEEKKKALRQKMLRDLTGY
ncbi:MAG: hypothetical protein ACI4F7_08220 [Acutalibacteraceae bacterium]